MKIVFSRKGFDSTYGGIPSPILEDGTIISFPIPSERNIQNYNIRYKDLEPYGYNLGQMIEDLGSPRIYRNGGQSKRKNTVGKEDLAHLDPDIFYGSLPERPKEWRGLFGQCDAAQGHLRNEKVGIGDLFLFYGLYQRIKQVDGKFVYDKNERPIHLIWGWLQVAEKIKNIAEEIETDNYKYPWAKYHQHYHYNAPVTNNTIYVAKERLEFEGLKAKNIKGYGVFEKFDPKRMLTDPDAKNLSYWRLPAWMYKNEECPITYNGKQKWYLENGYAKLHSFPRAQEYVFDASSYPQTGKWLNSLF